MSTGWSSERLDFAYMDQRRGTSADDASAACRKLFRYHCEQAAEKFLKATPFNSTEPPKTHDLIQLCKLCCEVDTRF